MNGLLAFQDSRMPNPAENGIREFRSCTRFEIGMRNIGTITEVRPKALFRYGLGRRCGAIAGVLSPVLELIKGSIQVMSWPPVCGKI